MSNLERCYCCGGKFIKTPSHNSVVEWKCASCGRKERIQTKNDINKIYAIGAFSDDILELLNSKKMSVNRRERIKLWEEHDKSKDFNNIMNDIRGYGGSFEDDPLLAICHAAHLTNGFVKYNNNKDIVEKLYSVAKDFLKENKKASKIKRLVKLYERRLRNKSIFAACTVASITIATLMVTVLGLYFQVPVLSDDISGITVKFAHETLSIFEKNAIELVTEIYPESSYAYIDAKNTLKNESDKFVLYDLSLRIGEEETNFNGEAVVTINIPDGYQASCLKIYHIVSKDVFEEIPSSVSYKNNTISFQVNHFSYYAVVERNPIVSFVYDNGQEIERIFAQHNLAMEEPKSPVKQGYTFLGWAKEDGVLWDFEKDEVIEDITLCAKWAPNKYNVTFDADGEKMDIDKITVTFTDKYSGLPTAPEKEDHVFLGWFTSKVDGVQITSESQVEMACDHTLYAIYKSRTNKITGISNTPDSITGDEIVNKAIIDWSGNVGASVVGKEIHIYSGIESIHIIGNPNIIYTNTAIVFHNYANNQSVNIILENFKCKGGVLLDVTHGVKGAVLTQQNCQSFVVNLEVRGNVSFTATEHSKSAIDLPHEFNIFGNGKLHAFAGVAGNAIKAGYITVEGNIELNAIAGDASSSGGNGSNGGNGIFATKVNINLTGGIINAVGGSGGNAYNRPAWDNDGDGKNGKNGYTGGNGGSGIVANTVVLQSGICVFYGGDGGNGGDGSEGNGKIFDKAYGGNGGRGGNGGCGIQADTLEINQATLKTYGGDGGDGGRAGGIHEGKYGSKGEAGKGGECGYSVSSSCSVKGAGIANIEGDRGYNGADNYGINQD